MLAENMAALAAFLLCVCAFALGYALRNAVDGLRAELATTYTYRPRNCGRGSHGGR